MKRYLKSITTMSEGSDAIVEQACQEWKEEGCTEQEFIDNASELAYELYAGENPDFIRSAELRILRHMADLGYISDQAAKDFYFKDENGMKVKYPDAELPSRLKNRPYGCRISRRDTTHLEKADELAEQAGFIRIRAQRFNRQTGKLSTYVSDFFAGSTEDIDGELFDVIGKLPGIMIGVPFDIEWSDYYNIEIVDSVYGGTEIKYHQLA